MKKLLLTTLFLFAFFLAGANDASATVQVLIGGSADNLVSSGTEYTGVTYPGTGSNLTWTGNITYRDSIVPAAGTIRNLYVELSNAPGNRNDRTFYLVKNGTATLLSCFMEDTTTTCANTANAITVAAGDTIAFRHTPGGGPDAADAKIISVEYESDVDKTFILGAAITTDTISGTRIYTYPNGDSGTNTTITTQQMLIPLNGTVTGLYAKVLTGGDSTFVFSIYKNGSEEATSEVTLNSGNSWTSNATSLTIDVAPGDLIAVSAIETAGSTGSYITSKFGISMTSDVDGESIVAGTSANNAFGLEYNSLKGSASTWQTEAPMVSGGNQTGFDMYGLYVELHSGTVLAAYTYPYTIRKNATDTTLTCTIPNSGTGCNSTTESISVVQGDELALQTTRLPSASANFAIRWAMIQFDGTTPPPAGGTANGDVEIKHNGIIIIKSGQTLIIK